MIWGIGLQRTAQNVFIGRGNPPTGVTMNMLKIFIKVLSHGTEAKNFLSAPCVSFCKVVKLKSQANLMNEQK